jgi:hypothetical protein
MEVRSVLTGSILYPSPFASLPYTGQLTLASLSTLLKTLSLIT